MEPSKYQLNRIVRNKYGELLRACHALLDAKEKKLLRNAFMMLLDVHKDRIRPSGEPYFFHAIAVAKIVALELGLGYTTIVSTLLQDALMENGTTPENIEKEFGAEIRKIIEGLTTISLLRTDKVSLHAENFIRLLLSLADDARVILIKLADRLHYMRVLDSLQGSDKDKIAIETSKLYTPIAHRLGLYNIKTELEELSMRYAEPSIYHSIERKLEDSRAMLDAYIKEFSEPIEKELSAARLTFAIKGRIKSVFSIWNKMKTQNVEFDEVYDLFAIRIVLNSTLEHEKDDCWKAYSVVTNLYQPNPKRLRDWITTHKENGYESLHTTVVGPRNRWVEVQIRTQRMDENAEKGHAAHWLYKGVKGSGKKSDWLDNIRAILEKPEANTLTEEQLKIRAAEDSIFVFTPQGDLKKLPQGASVLDFAYEVHTGVGEKCTGARVNGLMVPIKHILRNGDKVEILTSKNQKPNLDWLNWVVSGRARNKIKRFLRVAEYSRSDEGREMLRRKLNQLDLTFNDAILNKIIQHYKLSEPVELFHLIAEDKIDLADIKDFLLAPVRSIDEALKEKIQKKIAAKAAIGSPGADFLLIENNPEISDFNLAKCCQPVSGDQIFGFVTVGAGIKIHRADCPNALQMRSRYPYRVVAAKWVKKEEVTSFVATIRIAGQDRLGILNDITQAISQDQKLNLRGISVETSSGKFEGIIKVLAMDSRFLDSLLHRILKIPGVKKASRVAGN